MLLKSGAKLLIFFELQAFVFVFFGLLMIFN